jgi:hypothetical protein
VGGLKATRHAVEIENCGSGDVLQTCLGQAAEAGLT